MDVSLIKDIVLFLEVDEMLESLFEGSEVEMFREAVQGACMFDLTLCNKRKQIGPVSRVLRSSAIQPNKKAKKAKKAKKS